ncbi:hypothetical protein SDC9_118417 [bioreactor metagenome]|uniref:Uncharacterized protein n=1 Tax=bioreactor metagenome TaxID=1076179 RepID=A0A645C1F8_9ZZZZ
MGFLLDGWKGSGVLAENDGRSLEHGAGLSANGQAEFVDAVVGDDGAHRLAVLHRQRHFGIDRAFVDAGDFAPQVVAGGGSDRRIVEQQHRRRLDQGVDFHADGQPEVFRRFAGDHGNQFVLLVELEADLEVDVAFAQADDLAGELVAGAGLHRHALQQLAELLEVARLAVVHARRQAVERRLVLGFERPVEGDHLASVIGQLRTAAVLAAGRAQHQRLIGQVVHRVDGIPGRLVRQRHGFCCLRDRALLVDRLEQADAGVAQIGAEWAVEFEFAAQARKGLIHSVMSFDI